MNSKKLFASGEKSAAVFEAGGTFYGFFPESAADLCRKFGGELHRVNGGVEWQFSNSLLHPCLAYQAQIDSPAAIDELAAALDTCAPGSAIIPVNATRSEIDRNSPVITSAEDGKALLTLDEASAALSGFEVTRVLAQVSLVSRGGLIEDLVDFGVWVGNLAEQTFARDRLLQIACAMELKQQLFQKQWQGELFYPIPGEIRWE